MPLILIVHGYLSRCLLNVCFSFQLKYWFLSMIISKLYLHSITVTFAFDIDTCSTTKKLGHSHRAGDIYNRNLEQFYSFCFEMKAEHSKICVFVVTFFTMVTCSICNSKITRDIGNLFSYRNGNLKGFLIMFPNTRLHPVDRILGMTYAVPKSLFGVSDKYLNRTTAVQKLISEPPLCYQRDGNLIYKVKDMCWKRATNLNRLGLLQQNVLSESCLTLTMAVPTQKTGKWTCYWPALSTGPYMSSLFSDLGSNCHKYHCRTNSRQIGEL